MKNTTKRMWTFRTQWAMALRLNKKCLNFFFFTFHSPTGFDNSLTNARHRRQIGAHSHKWQSHSVNYQRSDLRVSPMSRWHPWNIWHAKYLELSTIHNPAVWKSSDWKIHQWWLTANERASYKAVGSSGGLSFFFYKEINHLQTTCIHFGIRNIQIR